ncbi:MAG: PAS domain S-box protein, partial [Deltaproteobacteria bacterium]|nr:PAS domain S-box protein [Deltaproteobacteria bacterium]
SAGGLEAFRQLLGTLPVNTGMAFVLVQHLEPSHKSLLTGLLEKATAMPVREVRQGMRVEPNHVYVIPANADLSVRKAVLHVARRKALAGHHTPIDRFFRSLAEAKGGEAIGVILSGTASDGSAGIREIKAAGGITFAQQPATAKFDGMPRNAIATGCVDLVLPAERIAVELARIARHPLQPLFRSGATRLEAVPPLAASEDHWTKLFRLLRTSSSVDFTFYKRPTIVRRLVRRMALNKIESMREYVKYAESKHEEVEALFNDILIHVTGFFREPEVFLALKEKVFRAMLAGRAAREPIRIWVPGCSTGEEVYSLAMCLMEYLGDRAPEVPIQIFGTDVSETAVEKARAGVYPKDELQKLSPHRVRQFFLSIDGSFQVIQRLRELCVFARHDVTCDPPFSRLDLISCRNVLIYFEPILQRKVLTFFHYALKKTGVFLLGKSEGLGGFTDLFTVTDRKNKFFSKNPYASIPFETIRNSGKALIPSTKPTKEIPLPYGLESEADRIVWDRYGHAGVVVNDDLQILHFRGDTSPFLRPATGRATLQLLRMVREELEFELRAAIQKARKSRRTVRREGIEVIRDGRTGRVNIEVRRLPPFNMHGRSFLILFEDLATPRVALPKPLPAEQEKRTRGREVLRLQNELAHTREQLREVVRDQDAANEELKTSNEEALSSMEELQSTNEELETAKEELQSSNEELVTLNEQLQNRNTELSRATDDLNNVISGVGIPLVLLDRARCIRRFNPPAQELLNLVAGDVGRPIRNLRFGIQVPDLEELIGVVDEKGEAVAREVQAEEDGRWYSFHIRPFHTAENKVEGVLLAFVDINELKRNEASLERERNFTAAIVNAAKDLLVVVLDPEGKIVHFNRACELRTGYSADDAIGRMLWDFLVPADERAAVKATFERTLRGEASESESHLVTKDRRRLLIRWSNSVTTGKQGTADSVIAAGIDQTARAEAQQRSQESDATVQALLETAAQAIVAVDNRGKILLVNPTTKKMFGYERQELIGQPVEILVPKHLRARHSADRANWFSKPRNRPMGVGLELVGLRKDGTEFPIEVSLSYLHNRQGMLGVSFISDITERQKNERTIFEYQEQLRRLTSGLLKAQENENRELARELHDVFSQELAALSLEASSLLKSRKLSEPLTERLARLGKKIGDLAEEMHRASRQIHPAILEELGLEPALREECSSFSERTGIQIHFESEKLPASIPIEVSLCLFRVAQESLRNIQEHAATKKVWVNVGLWGEPEGIGLRIVDKGDGFDVNEARKKGGLGLISMEERVRLVNGKIDVHSKPGMGTTVEVHVPSKKS